jgi:hypothetical protein
LFAFVVEMASSHLAKSLLPPRHVKQLRVVTGCFFSSNCNSNSNGRADKTVQSDPRYVKQADPRLLQALQKLGMDTTYPQVTFHNNQPVLSESSVEFKLDFYNRVEKSFEKMNEILTEGLLESDIAEVKTNLIALHCDG